jgi:hypothetical protein
MGELIRGVETPRIPGTNTPGSSAYKETHRDTEFIEVNEKDIAITRRFILDKYKIPDVNTYIYEYKDRSKPQRKIRAFIMLTNTEDPNLNFYAEGHIAHAVLNRALTKEFGKKINVQDFSDLIDEESEDFKPPWVARKGFLDPFHNGFKNFPEVRRTLIKQIKENQRINDLSDDAIRDMENGDSEIPNWFLSGDSSRESEPVKPSSLLKDS